jgi:ankyrin repeat protein
LIKRGADLDDEIFLLAIEKKQTSVIPLLLEKGVNVNAQNKSGSALQFAVRNRDDATTKVLLSHPDIDVNALGTTDRGITALHIAVQQENKDIVKQLLVLGADVTSLAMGRRASRLRSGMRTWR